MIALRWLRCRRSAALVVAFALAALGAAAPARAAGLFEQADASELVVRGRIEQVTPYPSAKLRVFHFRVSRVLKGQAAPGETVDLAQEMLFATTKPLFADGTETLVFAVPLPPYTSFQAVLPEGRHWRWTERLATAADLAPLVDPALTDAVARYLAVRDDPEALANFLVSGLVGADARVRQAALVAISTRREIPPLLDAGRLQPLVGWLPKTDVAPSERANVLVQLARDGAPGAVDVARGFADDPGPMQAAAVDVLITAGALPSAERLLALSRSPDAALRLVAGRGLAKLATPPAVDRLAAMLTDEQVVSVRLAIIKAMGRTSNPRTVELMAKELQRPEKDVTMAAADVLAAEGSAEAVAVLEKALAEGPEEAKAPAAFALRRMQKPEAEAILARLEESHPDPKVRRLCKLARGESMHEH